MESNFILISIPWMPTLGRSHISAHPFAKITAMEGDTRILLGDAVANLSHLPPGSIACAVTSPPYFRCRVYGEDSAEIGRENTPDEYVEALARVFDALRPALREDGVLWVNLGDSIADKRYPEALYFPAIQKGEQMLVPLMFALSMRRRGWHVQQDIIWAKTNPMPCSTPKRCTPSHEYVFMLTKAAEYQFDPAQILVPAKTDFKGKPQPPIGGVKKAGGANGTYSGNTPAGTGMARKRDVWFETTSKCAEAHFAPFPETIVEPCILASSRVGDMVLDPFAGTGTTGMVARRLGRKFIGCELYPVYAEMARKRLGIAE